MKPRTSPDDPIKNELEAACNSLRELTARLELLLDHQEPAAVRWISTAEAVELARTIATTQSIRNWARRYHLGILVRGRWLIDRQLLVAFLRDRAQNCQ
jgi:hypothetical protein